MSSGEKFVAAAYALVFAAVLAYVVIIALKLARLRAELAGLETKAPPHSSDEPARRPVTGEGMFSQPADPQARPSP